MIGPLQLYQPSQQGGESSGTWTEVLSGRPPHRDNAERVGSVPTTHDKLRRPCTARAEGPAPRRWLLLGGRGPPSGGGAARGRAREQTLLPKGPPRPGRPRPTGAPSGLGPPRWRSRGSSWPVHAPRCADGVAPQGMAPHSRGRLSRPGAPRPSRRQPSAVCSPLSSANHGGILGGCRRTSAAMPPAMRR